jgi:hypothetical protein
MLVVELCNEVSLSFLCIAEANTCIFEAPHTPFLRWIRHLETKRRPFSEINFSA